MGRLNSVVYLVSDCAAECTVTDEVRLFSQISLLNMILQAFLFVLCECVSQFGSTALLEACEGDALSVAQWLAASTNTDPRQIDHVMHTLV